MPLKCLLDIDFTFHYFVKSYDHTQLQSCILQLDCNRFWAKLPPEVRPVIQEVAARFELKTGSANKVGYKKDMAWLRSKINVRELPESLRLQ